MKINEYVYLLNLNLKNSLSNDEIYPVVLKDGESLILIDTGFPGLLENIYEAFVEESLDIDNMKKIILTHQDIDHIGNAKLLKEKVNNIKVLCYEEEAEYIDGRKKPVKLAGLEEKLNFLPEEAKKIFKSMERGFETCRLNIDETLKDGDVMPICGGINIIHTPGHTPGHICLYLNKYKILIAGDIVGSKDGKLYLTSENFNYDSEENRKSVEKLLSYDIDRIICYHGGMIEGNIKDQLEGLLS